MVAEFLSQSRLQCWSRPVGGEPPQTMLARRQLGRHGALPTGLGYSDLLTL